MLGFLGRYQTTLDEKGRFSLPAKLRSVVGPSDQPLLERDAILTKGWEGCLSLYPLIEWEEFQRRLASQTFTQKDFRDFSRRFYSSATVVTPDKSGRILIPGYLVEEAGLGRELLVLGLNRYIEIWNPEHYRYNEQQGSGKYEEVAERLLANNEAEADRQ